ncbi:MAG: aspartoacylase [Symploca sp. SIO1C4]|uniref:Probable aspartoacylase n=1 Tax=Symploca sp. SIO1C4 TaxID=2607765 RepID=A0A6B3NGH0_9CYAN|nr:aspartoacylase [Symploca sp. SIO1C4]NET07215.1 aspartoacylase [Symploca sp. SIO2B6]NET52281.1 aspartoacylase [Merismopedia sp. SIO2A8]
MNQISQVAIVGGTHGNELIGVYLVKKFKQFPDLIKRPSFETLILLANLRAFEAGRRYLETDLNRCFDIQDLENPMLIQYEQLLAKVIYQQLQESQVDFLIDLHSSTANMGLTILLGNDHPFNLHLAAYLSSINPSVKVLQTEATQKNNRLRSVCELGITIEVGPISQGVLDATLFQKTEKLITVILDYLEQWNQNQTPNSPNTLTLYYPLESIDFPRNEAGEIVGMIHPSLEGNDYLALNPGDQMFVNFDDSVVVYQGKTTVYPVFINESAYWEKGIAMYLTSKQELNILNQ